MNETPADAITAFYEAAKRGGIDKAKQYVSNVIGGENSCQIETRFQTLIIK
jgi:hypothetical protein